MCLKVSLNDSVHCCGAQGSYAGLEIQIPISCFGNSCGCPSFSSTQSCDGHALLWDMVLCSQRQDPQDFFSCSLFCYCCVTGTPNRIHSKQSMLTKMCYYNGVLMSIKFLTKQINLECTKSFHSDLSLFSLR